MICPPEAVFSTTAPPHDQKPRCPTNMTSPPNCCEMSPRIVCPSRHRSVEAAPLASILDEICNPVVGWVALELRRHVTSINWIARRHVGCSRLEYLISRCGLDFRSQSRIWNYRIDLPTSMPPALVGDEKRQSLAFVRKMLQWSPERRSTAGELFQYAWLQEIT